VAFQTELLANLMDRLLVVDLLGGEIQAPTVVPGGSYQNIPANIAHLTGRIVDKLWQGMQKL